jgi:acyl-CoA dehydrogenase
MAQAANAKLASGEGDAARMTAKLATARFFAEHRLPDTAAHLARIKAGAASLMELPAEAF